MAEREQERSLSEFSVDELAEKYTGDGLIVERLELGGLQITDSKTQEVWAVPANRLESGEDPFVVDTPTIPGYHVQLIREKQWPEYERRKFRIVQAEEVDSLPEGATREYGTSSDSKIWLHDSFFVKIPQVLYDLQKDSSAQRYKDRLASMEPTNDMMQDAARIGFPTKHKRQVRTEAGESIIEEDLQNG